MKNITERIEILNNRIEDIVALDAVFHFNDNFKKQLEIVTSSIKKIKERGNLSLTGIHYKAYELSIQQFEMITDDLLKILTRSIKNKA